MTREDVDRPLPASFHRLILAWAGSLTGDGLRIVALPLLAATVDSSPGAVAAVAVAATLPWLTVAVPAGALVDRLNPARVMMIAHCVRAVLTAALAVIAWTTAPIPVLCLIAFAITAAETFADGAAQSLLVRGVPVAQLEQANARFVTVETVALDLAGPLLAGVLFVLAPWLPFALSAVCFLASAAATLTIAVPASSRSPSSPDLVSKTPIPTAAGITDRGPSPGALAQVRVGLAQIASDPVLRILVITVAIMATANAATDAVLVLYATESVGLSAAVYPTLLAAYSVGILTAAALIPRLTRRFRGGPLLLVAGLGIGLTMLALGVAPVPWVAWLSYAVMGLAGGTFNVLSASRRQRQTPLHMIARVSSAFRVAAWGLTPVGAALGGVVGEWAGVPAVFVVAGAVIILTVAVASRSFLTVEPEGRGGP